MKDPDYVVWSGKLSVKGLYGCGVQIISPELLDLPVKLGTSINISCKLGLREGREKFLHRVTSLKSGIETYNDGRYINVCRMKVYQSKSNFEKIRNYLTSQECMAVLKIEEDILLLMTDNTVTSQLGLTEQNQDTSLHCVFLSRISRKQKGSSLTPRHEYQIAHQTKRMDEKGDYDQTGSVTAQTSERLNIHRVNTENRLQKTETETPRIGFQELKPETMSSKELGLPGTGIAKTEPVLLEHETPSRQQETATDRLVSEQAPESLPLQQGTCESDKNKGISNTQAPIVVNSDSSLQSALGRIFGNTEIIESSRSPFPENYTELIVDQSTGNRIGFDLGGVLSRHEEDAKEEGEGSFNPSPEYSNKLAEALSLSCQEGGQKLAENDDLPPLIPWLPVNISETASTPKSPLGKSKHSTTQTLDPHQNCFSDNNNNNLGNSRNCSNLGHIGASLGLHLSQCSGHQIGAYRSVTPPPPYLQQEAALGILHGCQNSLSRPPSLETVYSKNSPGSSRENSSLGTPFKSDSFLTPHTENTSLGKNPLDTTFSGNQSESSHFVPCRSTIQSAPLDVSFIKQEPVDDYWSTSLSSDTVSHPVETVDPVASEDISLNWPRHFMDAFLESKPIRKPCTRKIHIDDSPMFTPEHKQDSEDDLSLARISSLEKSANKTSLEAEGDGKSPIYGPTATQSDKTRRQAEETGNLAVTVCQLLEADQMELDDVTDIKEEPEIAVNRLYSEYQDELKGLPEKPRPHRYRCWSVSDLTRHTNGLRRDNNGKQPDIHLLLDDGFWPKPPRTSLLKHSRVRKSFIDQAKKRTFKNTKGLARSCSLFELKELIEKYGNENLAVPKRPSHKEVKTSDIPKKDKKTFSKTSKKADKNRVVDPDISDFERREEIMDVEHCSVTDVTPKLGDSIQSLTKTPDKLLPKVVLEKLNLSGKKSCKLGEPVDNTGSGKEPIKLKLILSPEGRVSHSKANEHQTTDIENSTDSDIDSDAPLDTVLKKAHSAEKNKKKKLHSNEKLTKKPVQFENTKTDLDTICEKKVKVPGVNETHKAKVCDENSEGKERTRNMSESDSKHSSHHHKKHKHDKHKQKSKHSHKSKDDKSEAIILTEKHSDKPNTDNLEKQDKLETKEPKKVDQVKNKDALLDDHIETVIEYKKQTSFSGGELSVELPDNEIIETSKQEEHSKESVSESKNDTSGFKTKVGDKTNIEKSLKSPEKGMERKTHAKKKHKDKRKENDLKTKDKHVSSFTKALDDIVSAKVDEIVAGSKKRKAEENRSDSDRTDRKHKSGSPKRKQSKTDAGKAPSSKVKRTIIKTSSLSRQQEAADRVLLALNMGVSRVEVSSLGRIPKKQSGSSSKKTKKEEDTEDEDDRAKKRKTGEKENVGKTSKDDGPAIQGESDHKKEKKLKGKIHGVKDRSKCTATESDVLEEDNRKRHFSANSVSERGAIAAADEMVPGSDFDDFVDNQKPLYKIDSDVNDSLKDQETSLFTSVMATRPDTGTIPGLGDLEKQAMSPTVETWTDLSKRQVLKSGSGLKIVLSGYDPVDTGVGDGEVDITECLLAALHRVRGGKQLKKHDFWTESIHFGLHSTTDWQEKKTVAKSVNAQGARTVLIIVDIKPDHIEHTEKEKEKTTEAKDSEASAMKHASSNETEDRWNGDLSDKKKKSDLVLNIPEKMVVSLEESLDESDTSVGNVAIDEIAKDDIDIHNVEETMEPSHTLNMSFGTSLKHNLLVVHDIRTENLEGGYDKLSESYAGEESKAGPEKTTASKASPARTTATSTGDISKTGPPSTKGSTGDDYKAAKTSNSSLVIDVIVKDKAEKRDTSNTVNVTVHLDDSQASTHNKKDETNRKRHSSSITESKDGKNKESRDRDKRSRSKSGDWLVLSSEGLSVDIRESIKERDKSPSRRRSRSKSKSKDEVELAKSSGSRSRNNSESKTSRSSRDKSIPKESSSEKSSRASSEVRDDKSDSKRRNSSGAKTKDSSKEDKDKRPIAERLDSLSKKSVPASEAAKADSRHSRQYHPYKKEEKKEKKSRKPKWSFDMAYRDMNELLQNLTTNFFKETNRKPAPIPKTTSAKSYDRKPRRFAGYKFERSEIPKNMPRTRSPSPFDEEDDLGPDMIPDLAERQEKADELEEQFMQTTVASEDEEYNREQDIYSQDEDEDVPDKQAQDAEKNKQKCGKSDGNIFTQSYHDGNDKSSGSKIEKTDNSISKITNCETDSLKATEEKTYDKFPNSKGDMPDSGSLKSLTTLVIPGSGRSVLYSGTDLDEENEYSMDFLGGPPSPLGCEVALTIPQIPHVAKTTSAKGVTLRKTGSIPEITRSSISTDVSRDENLELGLLTRGTGHKSLSATNDVCKTTVDEKTEKSHLEKKVGNKNQSASSESVLEMLPETSKLIVNNVKDRSLLLSVDSDSCLDWTDDEISAEKVTENTAFASNDEFSDIGEEKKYLVVDSIGDCDQEYDETKRKSDQDQTSEIASKDNLTGEKTKEDVNMKYDLLELKNNLKEDRCVDSDVDENDQPDKTESSALELSPTPCHVEERNNLIPRSSVNIAETGAIDQTAITKSEEPSTLPVDEKLLTCEADTNIDLEEQAATTELPSMPEKESDAVSEAYLEVVTGEANDSLDLSQSPSLVIDENGTNSIVPESCEDKEGSKSTCVTMLHSIVDDGQQSVENSVEMIFDVTSNYEILHETGKDTQETSEAGDSMMHQSDRGITFVEMSDSSVQLELAKTDCENLCKVGVDSGNTTALSSAMAGGAGPVMFIDEIDTVEEEVINDTPTAEDNNPQKHDTSLIYLDDTVSSCDEAISNTMAAYNDSGIKEECPSIVYLDDTVTSADEAVQDSTDETDVMFVKKTKAEESSDDVIYIPEATEEIEIVHLQDTTDTDNSFSCPVKEETQGIEVCNGEVEPVDLSCHGNELQMDEVETHTVVEEGVNTDERFVDHDEDENNDITEVVGVVNSGLDSPAPEETVVNQGAVSSFTEAESSHFAKAEETHNDEKFAVTGFPGAQYQTGGNNHENHQTDNSFSTSTEVTTSAEVTTTAHSSLPIDMVNMANRQAETVETVTIAESRSHENILAPVSVPSDRYHTRSVAGVAPLTSVSTPSHGQTGSDNCEWISPPSQTALHSDVDLIPAPLNLSHSVQSFSQSPLGSYMVPGTAESNTSNFSHDPLPRPYFVSPYLSPSPLHSGLHLLGSSPFPICDSQTVMTPFMSTIQASEWPNFSSAPVHLSPRGLVPLGSTISNSSGWQNYQSLYRGSSPQLYPSAHIQQSLQPPGSAGQLQPWMFSVRLPPDFRPTNPDTFFSVIQPRTYTFDRLFYPGLSILNHTINFDPSNESFGKIFTIPTLKELCSENIKNDKSLKSSVVQSLKSHNIDEQNSVADDTGITKQNHSESGSTMAVDCLNPYREKVEIHDGEMGLDFDMAISGKGLVENSDLSGSPVNCLEIPENKSGNHLMRTGIANRSQQSNKETALGVQVNVNKTVRQNTRSKKNSEEKCFIGEMESFYTTIDPLLNKDIIKDCDQVPEWKKWGLDGAQKSSATEFSELKYFSASSIKASDGTEELKLPSLESQMAENGSIKPTVSEQRENSNTEENTPFNTKKEIESLNGKVSASNKADDSWLLSSDIKDCFNALELKRKELEDAAKSTAVEILGIGKDDISDLKTVSMSDSYVWNGKVIPLNKQVGRERAHWSAEFEPVGNSYLKVKHDIKGLDMPIDRACELDSSHGNVKDKYCLRETTQQNEVERIEPKKSLSELDQTTVSERVLVTNCVTPEKGFEEPTERGNLTTELLFEENSIVEKSKSSHTNIEVTKFVSVVDKMVTVRDKKFESYEDGEDTFHKADDHFLQREDIKDCLRALERKRKEIEDAAKSNTVDILGMTYDETCDTKYVDSDMIKLPNRIEALGTKGAGTGRQMLSVNESVEMDSDSGSTSTVEYSSLLKSNHQNDTEVLKNCVTTAIRCDEGIASVDPGSKLASMERNIKGICGVECINKNIKEGSIKEKITRTATAVEPESFDLSKTLLLRADIKECLEAIEAKRMELKDAAKSSATESLDEKHSESGDMETSPMADCYIWNGQMIPINKSIGPEREDNVLEFKFIEASYSNGREDMPHSMSDPPIKRTFENSDFSESSVDKETSNEKEKQQQKQTGLITTDSHNKKCNSEIPEMQHTNMESTTHTSKDKESKPVKGTEHESLFEEDEDNKVVHPLLLNPDIKDCLKALEIKRKELEDAAESNVVEVLGLKDINENVSLEQSESNIPKLTSCDQNDVNIPKLSPSSSVNVNREHADDSEKRNDTYESKDNQMDKSLSSILKSDEFENGVKKSLVDYMEDEEEEQQNSCDAKSLNIVAYEEEHTDNDNYDEDETEGNRTICADSSPTSTSIKHQAVEEIELCENRADKTQVQGKMVEPIETDICTISGVSEIVPTESCTYADNEQLVEVLDIQFSAPTVSQEQLKLTSDTRLSKLDKEWKSVPEVTVKETIESVKYSEANNKSSLLPDVMSDNDLYKQTHSPVFTDEETEFSDSSSLTLSHTKQAAKSKLTSQKNLSISLLSSAYDDESDDDHETSDKSNLDKSGFKDSLAALKGYTDENSDSSDSESDSSPGESSSDSSDDESELTDNQDGSVKGSNKLSTAENELSSSDELRDELLENSLKGRNDPKLNVKNAGETKEKPSNEMDKYMKCKWVEDGIQSPDNSDIESICNTSCGSPDTLKAISDTEELYQSDAIIHKTPMPQSSEGEILDSSVNDGRPSLLSTKRTWINRTKPQKSTVTESDTEKPNALDASFAESTVSNMSNLSLSKLEQRQKKLINQILMQGDSDSSVTTGSGSGSENSTAKVKAAVTKKLADIRFWLQKGEDEKQKDINEAIQKKTEETRNLSRKETKLLRRKILMEKLKQERMDTLSSDNDERQYSKLETSRGYSLVTVDSESGSNIETKSPRDLSDTKSAGVLSNPKSAGELSDSSLSVKSVATVRSLGQRSEADLRAVVITIKNDRVETSKSDYQRTSSPIGSVTRTRTQSGSHDISLEYELEANLNKAVEVPNQNKNKVYHQDSCETRTESRNRHTGSVSGTYGNQGSYTTVARSDQMKPHRERHRSCSGSVSSLASDSEVKTYRSSNVRLSPRKSRWDGSYLRDTREGSREAPGPVSRGYTKGSNSQSRYRHKSRSASRESSVSSSGSHFRGRLNSLSPRRRFRTSRSKSPSLRSRSRSGSFRPRTGSRSGNARRRSNSGEFQRHTRSPTPKRPDSRASSSSTRYYDSRNRPTSGTLRKSSRSPGLRSRSGSRDSRQSRYSRHERYRRSESKESGALSSSSSDRGFDERYSARRDIAGRDRFYSERYPSRRDSDNRLRERDVISSGLYKESNDAWKNNIDYISRWNIDGRQESASCYNDTGRKQPTFAARVEARSLIDEMKDGKSREVMGKRKELARYEVRTVMDKKKEKNMVDERENLSKYSARGHARFDLRKKLGPKENISDHKNTFRDIHNSNRSGGFEARSEHLSTRTASKDRMPREVKPAVKKEKIVILHSSVLAYEKLDDLYELIKSLAQYSTRTCHWKALIHSRMICDLDEWRSVNPDCGSLLELLSRYRADDHVELLPFHGCDENKMATVQCAEQILRERNNVQMAYLIGGKSFSIQIRTPPAGPTVCTENPVEQLDILVSRGKKSGKGLMYVCIGEHKCSKEKPFAEFTFSVVVDGITYKGTGRSKKEAKMAAAKSALTGRFKILSVPMVKKQDLTSTNPHVVICSMEDFFELHLSSKHV